VRGGEGFREDGDQGGVQALAEEDSSHVISKHRSSAGARIREKI
jgi:hypothetical protein